MYSSLRVLLALGAAASFVHCAPDFDELGNGTAHGGSAGDTSSRGGASTLGGETFSQGGSLPSGGTSAGAPSQEGGAAGTSSAGGAGQGAGGSTWGGVGTGGYAGADGGESGAGNSSGAASGGTTATGGTGGSACTVLSSTSYTGFDDKSLRGPKMLPFGTETYLSDATNQGAKLDWVSTQGNTCPGAVRLTATYKAYQATSSKAEAVSGIVDIGKPPDQELDWSAVTRLHMWVKVEAPNDYLQGVQAFVTSSSWGKYRAQFDALNFRDGDWHEIVLELPPDALDYDATKVDQFGIQALLAPNPPEVNPPTLPITTVVYIDDVWLDFTP